MEDTLIKEISRLNKKEKIALVGDLWDSIATDPEQIEMPEHHQTIVEERLQTLDEDAKSGKPWSEIRNKYK
ncbi:MAG: addiction module protein [Balneolaceae bacterium]